MKFAELELHPLLTAAIEKLGYTECTPVQELTMPPLLEGKDVAGLAQTGTGKTAAFLLPLMERILRAQENPEQISDEQKVLREKHMFQDWKPNQFILVLVPTRELAEQVYENALQLKGDSSLRAVSIYGGVSYDKQKEGLRNGVEFVIATPGRLIDLFKEHLVDMKQVRAIVFDEADRMFDMGFKDDMKFILQRVPKDRQFLVFSATLNLDVMNTAYQFGANPVEVNVSRDKATAENVVDKIFHVGQEEKGPHLLSLLALHKPRQAIVFSNFKMNVPRLTQFLNDNGFPAVGISSLLTQSQRTRVMEQFKGASDHNILVATDVAARGLDIKGVDMVVNFELPDDPENYVHRIGRTGRAGESGIAFSLISDRDVDALSRVEQFLKKKVDAGFLEEGELVKEFKAMPSDRGSRPERSHGGGGRSEGRPKSSAPGGPRREKPSHGPRAGGPRPVDRSAASGAPRPAGGSQRHGEPRKHGAAASGGQSGRNKQPRRAGEGRPESRNGAPSATNGQHRAGGNNRPQPRPVHARPHGKKSPITPVNQQSIGKKVGKFFKRLFGA